MVFFSGYFRRLIFVKLSVWGREAWGVAHALLTDGRPVAILGWCFELMLTADTPLQIGAQGYVWLARQASAVEVAGHHAPAFPIARV